MAETIYTIPINETFEACMEEEAPICPFCKLEGDLEKEEIDLILGASMMEPDIRIQTNKLGFCPTHFGGLLKGSKRLPLSLMLESHLNELYDATLPKGKLKSPEKAAARLKELSESCYICGKIGLHYKRMLANALYMWTSDEEFRQKFAAQKCFCTRHFAELIEGSKKEIPKKLQSDFYDALAEVFGSYFGELKEDVSAFCRSFDYRYQGEPLGKAVNSVERAIEFLK